MKIKHITIIGMGALGVLYGDFFSKALGREAVTFIADKGRIEKYNKQGVFCNGKKCDFNILESSNMTVPTDLLIFAVKATALLDAIQSVRNLVEQNTIILSLINGITSEEIIEEAYGPGHVLHCIAQGMDAVKLDNQLTYSHMGQVCIGIPTHEKEKVPMLDAVIELFNETMLSYVKESDIKHRIWSKWMLNVGVNQVIMVNKGTYQTVQQEGTLREMMKAAMREVISLAKIEKIPVTEDDLISYLELIDTLDPNGMPSMRQDGIAKRYSEVELFAGTVIKMATEHGISVPVNQELYREIKRLESEY